jgi:hypothetical protein
MAKWNYKGESFEFDEDLSAEEATDRIEQIIRERKAAANTEGLSGTAADESFSPRPFRMQPKESERGVFGDIGVGLLEGAAEALQGTTALANMYADMKFNTQMTVRLAEDETIPADDPFPLTTMMNNAFDEGLDAAGLRPETMAGEVASVITQFVVPGVKGAGAVSKGTRLGRLDRLTRARRGKSGLSRRQRLALLGQQAAGATAVDFLVSTEDTEGLHDFFELGPDPSAENKVGETATEILAAKLGDRLLLGAEAGVATAVLPPVVGAMLKGVAKVGASRPVEIASDILEKRLNIPTPISVAAPKSFLDRARRTTVADLVSVGTLPAVRASLEGATKLILKQEARILDPTVETKPFDNMLGKLFANLRYRGFLDPEVANINSLVNAAVEGDVKRADRKLKKVEQRIDAFLARPEMRQQTAVTKQTLLNAFMDVLETGQRPDNIPDELFNAFKDARNIIDSLSERLLETGAVRALPETAAPGKPSRESLIKAIRENIETGGYLRKRYAAYEDPTYEIAQGSAREREIFDLIRSSVGGRRENRVFNHITETLSGNTVLRVTDEQTLDTLTERQMREYIRLVLAKTPAGQGKQFGGKFFGEVPIRKLNSQLLNRRKVDNEVLQEILGQVRNPREAYIATVSDLSTFISTDSFFTRMREIADADIADATFRRGKYGEDFLNANERDALDRLRATNPTATAADLGPKTDGRYISVPEAVARKTRTIEERIERIRQQGGSDEAIQALEKELAPEAVERTVLDELQREGYYVIGRTLRSGDPLYKDPGPAETAFGAMHNIAVPKAMAASLNRTIISDDNFLGNILRHAYGGMLKLKGIAQFNKTILSPITQVRNVTSASLFALAQGNVGAGASLGQSVDLVLRDLINKKVLTADFRLTDEGLDYFVDLQQRGIIGSSAQLRELQDNLRRGVDPGNMRVMEDHALVSDVATTGPRSLRVTVPFTRISREIGSLDRQHRRNILMQFFGKAADAYRAGDDIWKIYNYEFESAKLREAYTKMLEKARANRGGMNDQQYKAVLDATTERFKREIGDPKAATVEDAIKNRAADIVRNVVPNYELVPQIIKDIRGLPVGNFIAFPSEIIRTGYNTLEMAMRELSSEDAAIREIGMRRLMSSLSTYSILGPALRDMSMTLTGVSPEEMESVNILAAPYQRNSTFLSLGRNDRGNLEVMDFSHFNPFDMLIRPYETVLNSLDKSNKLQEGGFEKGYNAFMAALGEFFEPFVGESIAFSAIRDVMPEAAFGRGGETLSGAKVYRDVETNIKKVERSIVHLYKQLAPTNIDPFRIPVGADFSEVEFSRFPRSILSQRPEFGVSEREPSTGRTYAPSGEIFRLLTGLSTQEVDPSRVAKFKANEFKAKRSEAATLFNDVVNRDFAGEQDYVNGYLAANQARLNAFREFAVQMRALENLGINRREMRRILRKERVGKEELRALERGQFLPYSPAKTKLEEAEDKNHDIPKRMLRILERELRRLSIDPDFPDPTPEGAFDKDRLSPSTGKEDFKFPRKQPAPAPRSTVPSPAPQQPAAPAPAQPILDTSAVTGTIGQVEVEDLLQDPRDLQIARRRSVA